MTPPPCKVIADLTVTQYLTDARMLGHGTKTLKTRRTVLRLLSEAVGKPLTACTEDDLLNWYYRYESNPTNTRITYGRAVRSYYSWALRRGMIDRDPSLILPIPRSPKPSPNPLTPAEIRLALDSADPRTRLWLLLAVGAGLRAVEISRMRREHLCRESGQPVLTVPRGKGDRYRALVISDYLAGEIESYRRSPGRMWDVTPSRVSNAANEFLHGLGIDRTLHKGRHAFGSTFFQATRDLIATAEALGHGSVATVMYYAAASPEANAQALTALDALMRGTDEDSAA